MHDDYRELVDPNIIFSQHDHDYYHEAMDDDVYDENEEAPQLHHKHNHPKLHL